MNVYRLDDVAIRVSGNAEKLLSGLTSNTLDAPQNAFLNMHGRIIATFWQKKTGVDEYTLMVPRVALDDLLKHLDRYARLNRTQVTVSEEKVYLDLDQKEPFASSEDLPTVSAEEFTAYRLKNNVPLMGVDYQADEFILNVHEHDFTSYTKGCFLGQEPVSKVHNRAKPVRKLVPGSQGFVFVKNE